MRQLKASLRRDLEWLLNTRQIPDAVGPETYRELERSLYNYGLPDVTSMSLDSLADQQKLSAPDPEQTLADFEPRHHRREGDPAGIGALRRATCCGFRSRRF